MSKHRIVIIGGGFGGIRAALELARDNRFQVTLVSDKTNFSFYPTLYRTATGGRKFISSIPLTEIFERSRIGLIHDKIVRIDRENRLITSSVGHTLQYDGLIIALGVQTNYFNIKGLEEFSYGIKSIDEAQRLKEHLHAQLTAYHKPDLNYVVVGGGPTGVELAAALPQYLRKICQQHGIKYKSIHIDLVEAAPRILPRMHKSVSKRVTKQLRSLGVKVYTHAGVQAQTADSLMVNNKPMRSHTVIWTAGITNSPFFKDNDFQLAQSGKVRVDQFLQAEPGIYVIGDNADTPYSGMAQTALYDGLYVAKNLKRLADGVPPKTYTAKEPIYVVPCGPFWAVAQWGRVNIYGMPGWLMRRAADMIAYHDFEPWKKATRKWLSESAEEESCPQCTHEMAKLNYMSGEA